MKPFRIAMLAPLKRRLTPDTTVSRARVIVDLSTGLVKNGHEVTIFATQDSVLPGARIVPIAPKGLQFLPPVENEFYRHTSYLVRMVAQALKQQGNFDIIHNHMYPEYLALLAPFHIPIVTTVHSQMTPESIAALAAFPGAHLVAISEAAKRAAGIAGMRVVHNSVDTELFHPAEGAPKTYLLAVGRMSKAKDAAGNFLDPKGIGAAIAIAKRAGVPLKIVGNVEDPAFFETLVKPHLSDTIEFVGDVSPEQTLSREDMAALFRGAKAFINPINWEEPFGLVMAEALASGTPVVAFDRGAVREIVGEGVGFVVDPTTGIDGFVRALARVDTIARQKCRTWAVAHFSTARMVSDYEAVYRDVV